MNFPRITSSKNKSDKRHELPVIHQTYEDIRFRMRSAVQPDSSRSRSSARCNNNISLSVSIPSRSYERYSNFITPPVHPPAVITRKRNLPAPSQRTTSLEQPVVERKRQPIPKPRAEKSNAPVIPIHQVHLSSQLPSPKPRQKIIEIAVNEVYPVLPYTPGVCGLRNLGNTCFMNSALQCLSHIPDLTHSAKQDYAHLPKDQNNILFIYSALIQWMWSGKYNVADPSDIKRLVGHSFSIFADFGQKDAHEFMNSLLNLMEKTSWEPYMHKLFHIQTKSKVTCEECSHVDSTDEFNNFLPLALSAGTTRREISLVELIKEFTMEESLNGPYYCQHCNQYGQAKQKTIICSPLSRVLIIQLKRFPFDGTDTKINTFVRYELEYKRLLSENDEYHLCAVSVHTGTLAYGHYTTFAKNTNTQQWYEFDDSRCNEVTARDVITRNAYILVYLKSDLTSQSDIIL